MEYLLIFNNEQEAKTQKPDFFDEENGNILIDKAMRTYLYEKSGEDLIISDKYCLLLAEAVDAEPIQLPNNIEYISPIWASPMPNPISGNKE